MRSTLSGRIRAADRETLARLLTALAEELPAAAAILDRELPGGARPRGGALAVDAAAISRRLAATARDAYRGRYPDPTAISREMRAILAPAAGALEAGDAAGALQLHAAAWDALAAAAGDLWQDECELSDELDALGEQVAAAVLGARLEPAESSALAERIRAWRDALSGDCLETSLDVALQAAEEGWHTPAVRRALAGGLPRGALLPEAEGRGWRREGHRLHELRAEALQQRGEWEALAHYARAAGLASVEVRALLRVEGPQRALQAAGEMRLECEDAMDVVEALSDAGERAAALDFAERILEQSAPDDPGSGPLAEWAREAAAAGGDTPRALRLARAALAAMPSLEAYRALRGLAGDGWPAIRQEVLDAVERDGSSWVQPRLEILLAEGEVGRAIAALGPCDSHEAVELVVEAAMQTHPDWVFSACVHQFDRIADPGRSQYYRDAAEWLARARTALRNAGREAEWPAYLQGVLQAHGRKYSLKPLLLKLR